MYEKSEMRSEMRTTRVPCGINVINLLVYTINLNNRVIMPLKTSLGQI